MSFKSRWERKIKEAEEQDKKLEIESGIRGLAPFIALFLGWIPALFEKDPPEDEAK